MPFINKADFMGMETINQTQKVTKKTNWGELIDKFLSNSEVQKSIFKVIERFKQPNKTLLQPQQVQNNLNQLQNQEEIIKEFINRLCEMGQQDKTLKEIKKEFDKK